MKIISFNINGLRARPHQLYALIDKHQPDIIGLQEIKVDDASFPHDLIAPTGYHVVHHGQKGHYGVALLFKNPPILVEKGFPHDAADAQKRFLWGTYAFADKEIIIMNGYFPQGESRQHPVKFPAKTKFYADLTQWLQQDFNPNQLLILMGDINISPQDCDIGIGEENRKRWLRTEKCSFLPEEREWLDQLKKWGLVDSFRHLNPEVDNQFSWFDYRSRGFENQPKRGLRIDVIMASMALLPHLTNSGIDYDIRAMEKPSDHAPVWLELKP